MHFTCCPVCQRPIPVQEIERHVNNHFVDDQVARDAELAHQVALAPPSPPHNNNNALQDNRWNVDVEVEPVFEEVPESSTSMDRKTSRNEEPEDIDVQICYILSLQTEAPFYRVEQGLMNLLKNCLECENSTSLLSGYVDHFQSTVSEDKGWGCGWRNMQMVCSHLIKERSEARKVLFGGSGFVPDIGALQRWLEVAWQRGFDVTGANHFKGKVYGLRKWIGTTECAAFLRSFGLRARVVDFDNKRNRGKVGRIYGPMDEFVLRPLTETAEDTDKPGDYSRNDGKGYQALIDWVWRYFTNNEPNESGRRRVTVTNKMPLYFQHQGHSRTIVGIQYRYQKNGTKHYNLLVLDPGHRTETLESSLKRNSGWQGSLKRGLHTLMKPQYQICYVDPGIAGMAEMEQLKDLTSDLIQC